MKNIDWTTIKTEYISSEISMRKLAAKHNVDLKSIATHSKAEGWVAQRNEYRNRVQAKTLQNIEDAASNFQAEVSDSARKLRDKVNEVLKLEEALAPRDLKSISSTLLDLRDILAVGGDKEDSKNTITVRWENNPWDEEGGDNA